MLLSFWWVLLARPIPVQLGRPDHSSSTPGCSVLAMQLPTSLTTWPRALLDPQDHMLYILHKERKQKSPAQQASNTQSVSFNLLLFGEQHDLYRALPGFLSCKLPRYNVTRTWNIVAKAAANSTYEKRIDSYESILHIVASRGKRSEEYKERRGHCWENRHCHHLVVTTTASLQTTKQSVLIWNCSDSYLLVINRLSLSSQILLLLADDHVSISWFACENSTIVTKLLKSFESGVVITPVSGCYSLCLSSAVLHALLQPRMAEIFWHRFSDPSRIPSFPDSLVSNINFYYDYSFSNAGCRNCRSVLVLFQTLQIVKYKFS